MSSSRFAGKQLHPVGRQPLLKWVTDQLALCRQVDDIVLATVNETDNLPLKAFADKEGIACYWYQGEVDHVTTRLRLAAESYDADICILISADCPLIYAPAIDRMVRVLKENPNADTVRLPADDNQQPAALQGVLVNRRRAWQLADDLAERPELKEHQFPVIGLRPELFKPVDVMLPETLYMPFHRLSVDTQADLEFMNAVHDALAERNLPFELPQVVKLLAKMPDLKKINNHVHQRRLVEDIRKILIIVDAGGRYGYGHLMRCLELAQQITEHLGWPAGFLLDDVQAAALIEEKGFQAHWGAFSRTARPCNGRSPNSVDGVVDGYDLCICDIFDQRGPERGWRSRLVDNVSWVVIENTQPWVVEADLIVLPNILDEFKSPTISAGLPKTDHTSQAMNPKVVGGQSFIILRREIQQLASQSLKKEIDVLIYLQDHQCANQIAKLLQHQGLVVKIACGFDPGFALDLACARVFISGFGISFYEALALNTLPVCRPDSATHREDAKRFYQQLNMSPWIIETADDAVELIMTMIDQMPGPFIPIKDGTAAIVAEIAALCRS